MRRLVLALLTLASCARSERIVVVSPTEAANLSATYHDRVMVVGLQKAGDDQMHERWGALVEEGSAMVTGRNRRIAIDRDDKIRLRIDYRPGDPGLHGGVVRKGTSPALIVSGLIVTGLGAFALGGSIAAASSCTVNDGGGLLNFSGLCPLSNATIITASVAVLLTGLGLFAWGSAPTHLSLKF